MAGKLIALCAVVVSGCVPVIGTLYVPVNASDGVANRYSVCHRSAFFNRKIGDGLTLEVSITESGSEPPQLLIEGRVKDGTRAQFLDGTVKVSSASGIAYFELLSSGFLQLPQRFRLPGITSQTEPIVVSLPPVIVNGTSIEIEPIAFKPELNVGMMMYWMCQ